MNQRPEAQFGSCSVVPWKPVAQPDSIPGPLPEPLAKALLRRARGKEAKPLWGLARRVGWKGVMHENRGRQARCLGGRERSQKPVVRDYDISGLRAQLVRNVRCP